MGLIAEFKEFAMKGSVIDLAVGVIIGAAFGKIVESLVDDIVMPPIGYAIRGLDFSELAYSLGQDAEGKNVTINYGLFIQNCLHFLIVAFAIFMVIKQINRFKRQPEPETPSTRECPFCTEMIAKKASKCSHCTADVPVVA